MSMKYYRTGIARASFISVFLPLYVIANETELLGNDIQVITPTLLLQSIQDTPAPVTVITSEQIRYYGIRNIPEALRLVPGMSVGFTSGNEYRISEHGTNGVLPRRMQVLIDGMSIYRNSLSRVDWETMPVAMDDIERIEVTRAPAGATYGTNSFLGVVNIITRNPVNNTHAVEVYAGSQENGEILARYARSVDEASFFMTVRALTTAGFDRLNNPIFDGTDVEDGGDYLKQTQLFTRYESKLNNALELDTSLALVDKTKGTIQQDSSGIFGADETGIDVYYRLELGYTLNQHHKIDFGFNYVSNENDNRFNACYQEYLLIPELRTLYLINPELAITFARGTIPTGSTTEETNAINDVLTRISTMGSDANALTCGNINIDDKDTRSDFFVHDTYSFNDAVRMITGFNISSIEFESNYHLGGVIRNNRYYLFNNTEYKPTDRYTINIGVLAEMEQDYQNENIYWSPRLGLNYHVNPYHTLRITSTRSYRTPDLYERESNWQISVTDLSLPVLGNNEALHFFAVTGNPLLLPEEIRSTEVGLYSNILGNRVKLDINIYHQKLTNVIANGLSPVFVERGNDDEVILMGAETGMIYNQNTGATFNFGYAYQDSEATNPMEESLYARHSGFLGVMLPITDNMMAAIKYHATTNLSGNRYSRLDLALTHNFLKTSETTIDGQIIMQYHAEDEIFVESQATNLSFANDNPLFILAGITARY